MQFNLNAYDKLVEAIRVSKNEKDANDVVTAITAIGNYGKLRMTYDTECALCEITAPASGKVARFSDLEREVDLKSAKMLAEDMTGLLNILARTYGVEKIFTGSVTSRLALEEFYQEITAALQKKTNMTFAI